MLTPGPAVFEEGDAYREDDSRTAAADEAAEVRRLFTATGTGPDAAAYPLVVN